MNYHKENQNRDIAFTKGYQWFLCLNIVCCTWLTTWDITKTHRFIQTNDITFYNLCIIFFAAVNLVLCISMKHSTKRALYLRLLPAIILVFSLLWATILFTLITHYKNPIVSLAIMMVLLLPATIAFYISGTLLLLFAAPLIISMLYSEMTSLPSFSWLQIAAYFIIITVVYSARYVLLEWYQRSQRSEYEKNLLIQKLTKLAHYDSLTGLYNKGSLDTFYADSVHSLENKTEKLFLIILDIDFFKQYNDIYGHIAGDECLLKTSQCIESSLRKASDAAFRFGGEEFVVITLCSDIRQAIKISQRIKNNIAAAKIPHKGSQISTWLTASQGIAQYQPGMTLPQLIEAADQQLYKAKRSGRNTISCMKN